MLEKGQVLGVINLPDTAGGRSQQRLAVWDGDGIRFIRRVQTHTGEWESVVVDPYFRIPATMFDQMIDILMSTQVLYIEQGETPTPDAPERPAKLEGDGDHGPH